MMIRRAAFAILAAGLGAAGAAVMAAVLGVTLWPFELFSAFLVQAVLMLIALAAAYFPLDRRASTAALVLLVAGIVALAPHPGARPRTPGASAAAEIALVHANLYGRNVAAAKTHAWADENSADIIALTELPTFSEPGLRAFFPSYPYLALGGQSGSRKTAIFSRLPIIASRTDAFEQTAEIEIAPGLIVPVTAMHALVPSKPSWRRVRDRTLADLFAGADRRCGILVGDFNATPWSPGLKRAARESGFSRMPGAIWSPTWLSAAPGFGLTIDHVYAGNHVLFTDAAVGPFTGSDHRPILARMAVAAD